jgi:hypothetical protein
MDIRFETGSVVGKKSDTHWAQIVKTPYAFGVVELEDQDGHAQNVGMELVHKITKEVAEPIESIQQVFTYIDTLWTSNIQTLLLCVPIHNSITVILRGTGVVYLKRDGHIARLRSREGTISGIVYPEDILFLSSKTCLNAVSEDEFFTFFDHLSVEEVAEKLTIHLHKKNDAVGYAGLFVQAKSNEETVSPKEPVSSLETEINNQPDQPKGGWKKRLLVKTHTPIGAKNSVKKLFSAFRRVDIRITAVLIVLFFLSIGIGMIKERTGKKSESTYKAVEEGRRLYDEGVALLDLNAVKSRERLLAAKQLVDNAKKSVSLKTKEGRMLLDLEKNITDMLPKATKQYETGPELFFDVSLLKSGSSISSFAFYDDTMAFLDVNSKTVFTLQLSTKNGQIVGGGASLDGSQSVGIHGDNVYVFTPSGIHVLNSKDKTVKPLVIKKAKEWLSIKAMTAFAGNIYLLDTQASRIWKYVATGSAFTDLREYLLPDYFPDLSKAINMAIDGSVWLGTTDGTVMRFTQAKDDAFIPKGVEPGFGKTLQVFTDDSTQYVYVLDTDNKRVVVMEKDGLYFAQYNYPPSFAPTNIAVSEKLKKIFFFSEGKLYTVNLNI